jgi:hypothetical protein
VFRFSVLVQIITTFWVFTPCSVLDMFSILKEQTIFSSEGLNLVKVDAEMTGRRKCVGYREV